VTVLRIYCRSTLRLTTARKGQRIGYVRICHLPCQGLGDGARQHRHGGTQIEEADPYTCITIDMLALLLK
jgi:hypothetical protein